MSEFKVVSEGGRELKIEHLSENHFSVDGQDNYIDLRELGKGKYHMIKDRKSYKLELISMHPDTKELSIRVNGNDYFLKVEDRFDILLRQLGMDDPASAGVSELKAPMPGLVLSVEMEVGQTVKKDEPLLVLEAMKMENVLKSPGDMIIKSIAVEKGQAVEKNQLLVEFE